MHRVPWACRVFSNMPTNVANDKGPNTTIQYSKTAKGTATIPLDEATVATPSERASTQVNKGASMHLILLVPLLASTCIHMAPSRDHLNVR